MIGKRSTWRSLWPLLPVAAAAVLLYAQFMLRDAPPTQTLTPASAHSLRLMSEPGPASAGEMLAASGGLFEREGLHLELKSGSSADDAIASVARGLDTFGVTRADRFIVARAGSARVVGFAAGLIENTTVFYTLKSSGVQTPADFVGRRVGHRTDDTEISFRALVARLGLPRSRIAEVPVESDLSALTGGAVDVWPGHIGQEDYALAQQGAAYSLIDPAGYGIHLPGTVYFARESTIVDSPQLVLGFLKAVIAGWERAYEDPTRSAEEMAAANPDRLTADFVRFALDRQRPYLRPAATRIGEFSEAQWRSLNDALVAQRLIMAPADLSRAMTFDFLRDAYRMPLSSERIAK
jgi:ABC-type nitrate/sulfonate/bicarbonate transport system substrate-binding protein